MDRVISPFFFFYTVTQDMDGVMVFLHVKQILYAKLITDQFYFIHFTFGNDGKP